MNIKNYYITKNNENSILIIKDHQLAMCRKKNTNSDVYLSTADLKTGIIHDKTRILGRVMIEPQTNSSYALKEFKINKYYSSNPINHTYNFSYIEKKGNAIDEWEKFNLILTDDISLSLTDFSNFILKTISNPVNLCWWRCIENLNFGDELNPHIVSYLTKKIINKTDFIDVDLLAVGSLLDWVPSREKPYNVWGSGSLKPALINEKNFKPYLLRGPLTHSLFINSPKLLPYGDPGLLSHLIWKRSENIVYDWGIIPHHSQMNKPWLQNINTNNEKTIIIDCTNPDIELIIKQITSCKTIISSSLHGLIVADSYQIPSIWLWDDVLHPGGQWKFFDYFAGIGRQMIDYINPDTLTNLEKINIEYKTYQYFNRINTVCNRMIDAFPL